VKRARLRILKWEILASPLIVIAAIIVAEVYIDERRTAAMEEQCLVVKSGRKKEFVGRAG